jgi:DNA-binding CsgD family transcriptional regulator
MAKLPEPLTARELEILGLLAQRMSYKEIAGQLHISEGTVSQHINHIYRKLDARRRGEAISNALGILLRRACTITIVLLLCTRPAYAPPRAGYRLHRLELRAMVEICHAGASSPLPA